MSGRLAAFSLPLALLALLHAGARQLPPRAVWPPQAPGFFALPEHAEPAVAELSGLAPSRRTDNLWWGINDSGNPAALIALPDQGPAREIPVQGALNHDWEDLASWTDAAGAWLAVADTGDNFALRGESQILLFAEPAANATTATPVRVLHFRFEDGPRDVESLAADPAHRQLLLADKGVVPPALYALPLDAGDRGLVARRLAAFPDLMPTPPPRIRGLTQVWRGSPTALDLSPDGRHLLVLTYESLSRFDRPPDTSWAAVLAHPPAVQVRTPALGLLESAAFEPDGLHARIATEGPVARVWRWTPPPPRVAVQKSPS